MSNTTKQTTQYDYQQTLKRSYNDIDSSLTTNGFLTGLVGRKVTQVVSTTTISGDTSTFTFSESGTNLYAIKVIYTDGTQAVMLSAERTS